MEIQIVLEPSDEGGYTAYVPSLPGCISEGDTRDEALANIHEAIELYLEPVEDDREVVRQAYAELGAAGGDRKKAGWLSWDDVKNKL